MLPATFIQLESASTRVRLDWRDFDGDDCFGSFIISAFRDGGAQHFDFGPCAVRALRRMSRFISSPAESSVSGGFRYPDVRTYELQRTGEGFRLVVRFEASHSHQEFVLVHPSTEDSRDFLCAYDAA